MPEGTGEMTGRERRIAELAARDLDGWARELPLGSETRLDLQRTAGAYRFIARAGADAGKPRLRAVPAARVPEKGGVIDSGPELGQSLEHGA